MSNQYDDVPRDEIKVGYLVTGVVFLGLAGIWALREGDVIGAVTVGWLAPALLVVAGVVGLLAMLAGGRRTTRRPVAGRHPDPTDPAQHDTQHDTQIDTEDDR